MRTLTTIAATTICVIAYALSRALLVGAVVAIYLMAFTDALTPIR